MTELPVDKGEASGSAGDDRSAGRGSVVDRTRLAVPLALAVVASVFVALGIQGTILSRLLRNDPIAVAAAFALAIVGLAIPVLWMGATKRARSISQVAGAGLVLLGTSLAVIVGTSSYSEREHPRVAFSGTLTEDRDLVRIKASASAPTLKSNEKMLLRVAAVRAGPQDVATENEVLKKVCKDNTHPPLYRFEDESPSPVKDPSTVLFWGDTGPDSRGIATNEVALFVSRKEFAYACVVVALTGRGQASENRYSWAVIDLSSVATAAQASSQDGSQ